MLYIFKINKKEFWANSYIFAWLFWRTEIFPKLIKKSFGVMVVYLLSCFGELKYFKYNHF